MSVSIGNAGQLEVVQIGFDFNKRDWKISFVNNNIYFALILAVGSISQVFLSLHTGVRGRKNCVVSSLTIVKLVRRSSAAATSL
jgi:hypothetical protein